MTAVSYPHAVATGNAVILAAMAWDTARYAEFPDAAQALHEACAAHSAATAAKHVQGPDIDEDA